MRLIASSVGISELGRSRLGDLVRGTEVSGQTSAVGETGWTPLDRQSCPCCMGDLCVYGRGSCPIPSRRAPWKN